MMSKLICTAIMLCLCPLSAVGQLVPSPTEQLSSSCPNRPAEPVLIQNMGFRDAHRVLFIRDMYRAYTFNAVVETGSCSCDQRYPAWEPVVQYYLEHYAGIEDRHELAEQSQPYTETIQAYRGSARDICLAAGTWK